MIRFKKIQEFQAPRPRRDRHGALESQLSPLKSTALEANSVPRRQMARQPRGGLGRQQRTVATAAQRERGAGNGVTGVPESFYRPAAGAGSSVEILAVVPPHSAAFAARFGALNFGATREGRTPLPAKLTEANIAHLQGAEEWSKSQGHRGGDLSRESRVARSVSVGASEAPEIARDGLFVNHASLGATR